MHKCAYLVNFFDCYRTDPLPNQLVPLNNIKQLSHGVANLFSIRELHPTHGFKQRPLFEDVITNHLNIARLRILLLALGGPSFAHGHPLRQYQFVPFTLTSILYSFVMVLLQNVHPLHIIVRTQYFLLIYGNIRK